MKLFHRTYTSENSQEYLIILHGLFGMLDNWHNIAKKISEHKNVITVDCRNHGQSPHAKEMSYSLMAEDVAELLKHLSISKASIIGHSMGGKVAMKFADLFPQLLHKLVVVDIAPKRYKPGHTVYFNAFEAIDFSTCQTRKDADLRFQEFESNVAIRQFLLKNLEKDEVGYKLKFNLSSIKDFYYNLIGEVDFQWIISNPTLFINGGSSEYVTEEDQELIEQTFTDVTFVEVEGAGHWVHAEKPVEFLNAVVNFLS